MILGYTVQSIYVIWGGVATLTLLLLQVLVGMRVIRFKGRRHMKVHRVAGFVLLGLAAGHGLLAALVYNGWRILS